MWPTSVTGWAQLIATVLVLLNVGGLAGIWKLLVGPLHKRIDDECAKRKQSVNGVGERVKKVEDTLLGEQQTIARLELDRVRADHSLTQCTLDQARMGARMDEMEKRLDVAQTAILEAVHKVELQVATLAAKADVGKAIADGFDRIASIMIQRDRDQRRDDR